MEWLSNNWFFLVGLIGNLIMYGYVAGQAKQKLTNLETKVDAGFKTMAAEVKKSADELDEHIDAYNKHVADPDVHVNRNLRDLFDSRFKLLEEIQRSTRVDVGRLQESLDKM